VTDNTPEQDLTDSEASEADAAVAAGDAPTETAEDATIEAATGTATEDTVHGFEPSVLPAGAPLTTSAGGSLSALNDVQMVVTAELGRTTMPMRELLGLTPGVVVEIDRTAGSPIDLLVNGRRIASGEVVVIDEEFGIRITDIIPSNTSELRG
jgi:flagellar motor switch protein FliN/FliY